MPKAFNPLERPLDGVFSAASHIYVLRALRDSREGMSGRAVAREAEINHQSCANALKSLESQGVVLRQGSGKTQLVRLNFDSVLVRELILPFLRGERSYWTNIRQDVASKIKPFVLAATVFGSVARRQARPGSDVDLLLIVKPEAKRAVIQKSMNWAGEFTARYGVRLSPIILTVREARVRKDRSDPLFTNILKDGIDLLSHPLREVIA